MAKADKNFYCHFRFLSREANSALQTLRAQYEVRLIETRHAVVHDGWVWTESGGHMISHAAQIRLVDALIEMVETLYEFAAKAYSRAVGSSEYKEQVDLVQQQLHDYCLERWAQLTRGLPLEQVDCNPAAGTVHRSNEQLLSDTLAAHIHSKALQLELQMWKKEAAAQSGEFATVKLQLDPPASGPEAGDPHGVAKRPMGEDHFLKFLDPDYLRQMSERIPELASILPGIAGAAACIRAMEAAKAKAEIAFRQHEAAEKWGELDLDKEDPEAVADRFGQFGTLYLWRPAGCEYVWEIASTFLRTFLADCRPEVFETLAKLVIDEHSAKVYDGKLTSYERTDWINYETAKAEFQEYVRKRLDPLVRAECLDRWQKRIAAISTDGEAAFPSKTATPQPGGPTTRADSQKQSHEAERTVDTAGRSGARAETTFPARALWLKDRLLERGWSNSDPAEYVGPDRKTVQKILRGEAVRNDVLQKLAGALSQKHGKVDVLDIPQD